MFCWNQFVNILLRNFCIYIRDIDMLFLFLWCLYLDRFQNSYFSLHKNLVGFRSKTHENVEVSLRLWHPGTSHLKTIYTGHSATCQNYHLMFLRVYGSSCSCSRQVGIRRGLGTLEPLQISGLLAQDKLSVFKLFRFFLVLKESDNF